MFASKEKSWKDPLNFRIRRQVQHLLYQRKNDDFLGLEGLQFLIGKNVPICTRLIWTFAIVICCLICIYQIGTRITYFTTYPHVVDVHINKNETIYFPSTTVCTQATKEILEIRKEKKLELAITGLEELIQLLMTDLNSSDVYKLTDIEPEIVSLKFLANNEDVNNSAYEKIINNLGICAVFQTKFPDPVKYQGYRAKMEYQLRYTPGTCGRMALWASVHDRGIITEGKNYLSFSTKIILDLAIVKIKQYKFLNSPKNPCMETEEYETCFWQTAFEGTLPCRFPYFPFHETDLEECKSRPDMFKLFSKGFFVSLKHSVQKKTNKHVCFRNCNLNLYDVNQQFIAEEKSITILSTSIRDDHITVISERFCYYIIDLFCDIGGNLGLYLGMSFLSVFQIGLEIIHYLNKRNKNIFAKDVIFKKVQKYFQQEMKKKKYERQNFLNKVTAIFKDVSALSRACLFIFCFIIFMIQMHQLLTLYFSYPVKVIITLVQNETIFYPDITYCYESALRVGNFRRKAAKKLNVDRCDPQIQMPDMVNGNNSEKLWQISYPEDIFKDSFLELVKGDNDKHQFLIAHHEVVILPFGICRRSLIEPSEYHGTNTMFGVIVQLQKCEETLYLKMYISNRGDDIDLRNMYMIPNKQRILVVFTAKEILRLNTKTNPCLMPEKYRECRRKCYRTKLLKIIYCRLPYIDEPNLPLCTNSSAAWHTQKTYLDIVLNDDIEKSCNCYRSCKQIIYETRLESTGLEYRTMMAAHIFSHNYIEIFEEVCTYPLIKLFCDIGGNLGLFLGMSLLSLFNFAQVFAKQNV